MPRLSTELAAGCTVFIVAACFASSQPFDRSESSHASQQLEAAFGDFSFFQTIVDGCSNP
jgi:hypothetical protein